jgi:SAM-dependent methyltransferase
MGPPLPPRVPLPPLDRWRVPPPAEQTRIMNHLDYDTGAGAERYDVALLEQLNEEYADRPIVPSARSYQPEKVSAESLRRVRWAHDHVDLREKKVLEIGCGNGYEVWAMAHNLGCDAYGVDVDELAAWQTLAGDRVSYVRADLTRERPFEYGTFDRIVSYTVWEHVVRPFALLDETYKLLRPGGLAWIRANLYAGPKASHRYRDIYFPWPHLLFSDDVVRDWDVKHGRPPTGFFWVNQLSWEHYARHIASTGFVVRRLTFQECEWDEEFYRRFEDRLGRVPTQDLRRDFFLVVLQKPEEASV